MESDIRWGLKDPESGEEAQTLGRPARDRGLPFSLAKNLGGQGSGRGLERKVGF